MIILAIECSTESCSVACSANGLFYNFTIIDNTKYISQKILYMVDRVLSILFLDIKSVDYICYSIGPGSFTSLKIIYSLVQGLSFGIKKKIFGFSSLDIMVYTIYKKYGCKNILAMLDAKMIEVYLCYKCCSNIFIENKNDNVISPYNIKIFDNIFVGVGIGIIKYFNILKHNNIQIFIDDNILYPNAKDIIYFFNNFINNKFNKKNPNYIRHSIKIN